MDNRMGNEMISVSIKVPEDMAFYLNWQYNEKMTFEQGAMLLYPLIMDVKISCGRAAEILGVSKDELLAYYDRRELPCLYLTEEDLKRDLATIAYLKKKKTEENT